MLTKLPQRHLARTASHTRSGSRRRLQPRFAKLHHHWIIKIQLALTFRAHKLKKQAGEHNSAASPSCRVGFHGESLNLRCANHATAVTVMQADAGTGAGIGGGNGTRAAAGAGTGAGAGASAVGMHEGLGSEVARGHGHGHSHSHAHGHGHGHGHGHWHAHADAGPPTEHVIGEPVYVALSTTGVPNAHVKLVDDTLDAVLEAATSHFRIEVERLEFQKSPLDHDGDLHAAISKWQSQGLAKEQDAYRSVLAAKQAAHQKALKMSSSTYRWCMLLAPHVSRRSTWQVFL